MSESAHSIDDGEPIWSRPAPSAASSPRVPPGSTVTEEWMAGNSNEPGRTVTSKLAAILVAFTNGRDYTLSELAMQTNLAVSTVHRLLSDLVRTSLIERPDGCTYRPGPDPPRAALRGQAADAARAGAVRRGGPGGVAAHDRPPGCRRRPRGGLRREEGPGRSPARCSPTRPGCPCTPRPSARCCSPSGHARWSGSSAVATFRGTPPGPSSARSLSRATSRGPGPTASPSRTASSSRVPAPSRYPCSTSTGGRSPPSRWR